MFPEHPLLEETPAVKLTFSSSDSFATKALAFLYAEAQSPAPVPSAIWWVSKSQEGSQDKRLSKESGVREG